MHVPPGPPSDPFGDDRSFEYTVDHRVEPAARERFLATMRRLAEAESRWPGFLARREPWRVQGGSEELWRTSIRWRDLESWLAWMESPQRRQLLEEALANTGFQYEGRTNWQGYARWLSVEQAARTPLWKTNLLVLLVLYPTVMALTPVLAALPLERPAAVLLSACLSVAITGWGLMPLATRLYDGWLTGRWPRPKRALALASIPLSLALLWGLFQRG